MEVLFRSYELETANIIIGNYIKEDGFYMENGEPIYGKPCTRHYIQDEDCIKHEIAEDYLSINLKDMLDSQGNKIFASLSNDGKGGDICDFPNRSPLTAVRNTIDNDFDFGNVRCFKNYHMDCKVIGIHK